jgi:hypothetical protein
MVTLLAYIAGLEFSPTRKEEQLPLPNVEKRVVFGANFGGDNLVYLREPAGYLRAG